MSQLCTSIFPHYQVSILCEQWIGWTEVHILHNVLKLRTRSLQGSCVILVTWSNLVYSYGVLRRTFDRMSRFDSRVRNIVYESSEFRLIYFLSFALKTWLL